MSTIPEKEFGKSLSCHFRLRNFAIQGGETPITRGKFAIFLNKAIEQASLEYTLNAQAENVINGSFSAATPKSEPDDEEMSDAEKEEVQKLIVGAQKELNECLKKSKKCYYERAFLAAMKDDNADALKHINLAIAAEPKTPRYYDFRAELYLYDLDQYQNAWNDFSTLIRLEPKKGLWYRERAYTACRIPKLKSTAKQDEAKAVALGTKIGSPCK